MRGSLVGPLFLILFGLLFLLNNLGVLSWSVWESIVQLWPVLLIAIGLDLLLRSRLGGGTWAVAFSLLILLAVLGIGSAVLWLAPATRTALGHVTYGETAAPRDGGQLWGASRALHMESISQSLGDAGRADVELNLGVGDMKVRAMPEPNGLIEGSLILEEDENPVQQFKVQGGTAYYSLRTEKPFFINSGGYHQDGDRTWDLRLNPTVPMSLKLSGGVGNVDLDLSKLRLTDLQAKFGVSNTSLMLPRQGQLKASLEGGVGETTIYLPRDFPARIQVERGLTSVEVNGNYRQQGDGYVSPGYDGAGDRIDLTIRGGIGGIVVQEYDVR